MYKKKLYRYWKCKLKQTVFVCQRQNAFSMQRTFIHVMYVKHQTQKHFLFCESSEKRNGKYSKN